MINNLELLLQKKITQVPWAGTGEVGAKEPLWLRFLISCAVQQGPAVAQAAAIMRKGPSQPAAMSAGAQGWPIKSPLFIRQHVQ